MLDSDYPPPADSQMSPLPAAIPPEMLENEATRRAHEASVLVAAAKAGDARAFDELVRRYRPRIFALALHLTGRPSDADDITQDAFLKAYARLHEFEGRSELFTWLYRIALHRALNVKRDQGRRRGVGLDDPRVTAAIAVDAAGDPRRALELQETYAQLVTAFDQLSPVLRTTLVLTTLQDLSHKEAAVVLGTSEGTIAWRVHEARRRMREAMEKQQVAPSCPRVLERIRELREEHGFPGLERVLAAWT